MKLRVLLADDHRMFREALRVLIEQAGEIDVVAETGDGIEIIDLVRKHHVDIVCMDVSMPGMNGIEATRRLHSILPEVRVIGLSVHADPHHVSEMLRSGALAYVTKSEAVQELLRAIQSVAHNRLHLCPEAMLAVSDALLAGDAGLPLPRQLGARERQVLQLVAEGHSSADIGERLHISPATVEVHRRNIMRKLDLHNVADLTRYAIRAGVTSL